MENNQLNRAKTWQIIGFSLNNTATNCCFFIMMYISYYAAGILGLGVLLVSQIIMGMRLFDAFTDPIIGFVVDKTKGKFGKYRPFLVIGQVIIWIALITMFFFGENIPENFRLMFFIASYGIYVVGYTFQTTITKAAQVSLTNDPKQRPLFSLYDGIFTTLLFAIMPIVITSYLTPKYSGVSATGELISAFNNIEFFKEFVLIMLSISAIFTVIAVIAISGKDKPEFWGVPNGKKITFKDYWQVLKGNRAIQMLVVAASTDKLAGSVAGNATIGIMLYAIIIGNFSMMGTIAGITSITTVLFLIFGTKYICKQGFKKGVVITSIGGIISQLGIVALLFFSDRTSLDLKNLSITAILFVIMSILVKGFAGVSSSIVIPMTADCTDYETYKSGRFVPGLMGSLFSFVDKVISSFATAIIGFVIAFIGFKDQFPTDITPYSDSILYVTIFLFCVLPIIGLVANLIAMKFYPLTREKMEEVQAKLTEIKNNQVSE